MTKQERKRFSLIRKMAGPGIYQLYIVALSGSEWAASVVLKDGNDKRFRFTGGKLINEADIGDDRIVA